MPEANDIGWLFPAGSEIGKYRVIRPFGRDRYSEFSLAEHRTLRNTVVLRLFDPAFAADEPEALERFLRAVRPAARLNHPDIAGIIDILPPGPDAPCLCLVTEYMDGGSVADRVAESPLPFPETLRIASATAEALAAAEASGIRHGSLAPERLLLSAAGEIKVAGFGEYALETTGEPAAADDLAALGAIWFELLTGKAPAGGPVELRQALRGRCPAPAARLIARLIGGGPDAPDSAADLCRELARPGKRPGRRTGPMLGGGLLLILLLSATAVVSYNRIPSVPEPDTPRAGIETRSVPPPRPPAESRKKAAPGTTPPPPGPPEKKSTEHSIPETPEMPETPKMPEPAAPPASPRREPEKQAAPVKPPLPAEGATFAPELELRLAEAFRNRNREALRELARQLPLDRLDAQLKPEEWTILFGTEPDAGFLQFLLDNYYTPHRGLLRMLAAAAPLNPRQSETAEALFTAGAGRAPDRFSDAGTSAPPVLALTIALARKGAYTGDDLAFCRKLLESGCGIDDADPAGYNALEMAAALPLWRAELVKLGAKPGRTTFPAESAKLYAELHRVPVLPLPPEKVPPAGTLNLAWPDGGLPLLFAIDNLREGFPPAWWETVRLLLRSGADPNGSDREGNALHHLFRASPDAQLMLLPELLKAGTDVNAPDSRGEAPIFTLLRNPLSIGQKRLILRLLLNAPLDLSVRAADGRSVLDAAPPPLLPLLRERGAAQAERLKKEALPKTAGERRIFRMAEVEFALRSCPPGEFRMGSIPGVPGRRPDELPHPVALSYGYWLGETEVTQQFYEAVTGENPSRWRAPASPVEQVTWDEAAEFCGKLTEALRPELPSGYVFRLPTEAEWEYAARAGGELRFSGSDDFREVAFAGTVPGETGTRKPNAWGFFDLSGNVSEWCFDPPAPYGNALETAVDPVGTGGGDRRALRGGSVFDTRGTGAELRTAARRGDHRKRRLNSAGFRIALAPELLPDGTYRKSGESEDRFSRPASNYAFAFRNREKAGGIELRVKPDDFIGGLTCSFWVRPAAASPAPRTLLRMRAEGEHRQLTVSGPDSGFIFHEESSGMPLDLIGNTPLPPGRWSHIALAMNDSEFAVYCNGREVCSGSFRRPGSFRPLEISLGTASFRGTNLRNPEQFPGEITDVALWNRMLAPTEIQPDAPLRIREGLLGYWNFTGGRFNSGGGRIAAPFGSAEISRIQE